MNPLYQPSSYLSVFGLPQTTSSYGAYGARFDNSPGNMFSTQVQRYLDILTPRGPLQESLQSDPLAGLFSGQPTQLGWTGSTSSMSQIRAYMQSLEAQLSATKAYLSGVMAEQIIGV